MDADRLSGERRILQFTPPGSPCSIILGTRLTSSAPGSAQFLHLVVSDIQLAREQLIQRGIDASEVFHDARGGYNRFDADARAIGLDPQIRSYASYLTFSDPDGNGWVLQEVTVRLPGRIDSGITAFASVADLVSALRRAAVAHGEHLGSESRSNPSLSARSITCACFGCERKHVVRIVLSRQDLVGSA